MDITRRPKRKIEIMNDENAETLVATLVASVCISKSHKELLTTIREIYDSMHNKSIGEDEEIIAHVVEAIGVLSESTDKYYFKFIGKYADVYTFDLKLNNRNITNIELKENGEGLYTLILLIMGIQSIGEMTEKPKKELK